MVTYVPLPPPPGPFTHSKLTRAQRKRVTSPWPDESTWDTITDNPSHEWWRYGGRTGSKGKKVVRNGHSWAPVRPYTRFGNQGAPSGSELVSYQGLIISRYTGNPRLRPGALSLIFPLNGSASKDLLDANGLPLLDSNTRSRLITECMVKIGDRKANYGESIGESRQTLNHLAKTSSRVIRGVLALRKGNLSGFLNALGISAKRGQRTKFPAQSWLEYQYAWMPLLNDIYDTRDILRKGLGSKPQIISATRQLTFNEIYERDSSWTTLRGPIQVRHRAKLWYGVSNRHLLRLNQLGLINPAEVAWALLPFSFIVDWFLPVQNVLEAHSALMGLSFIDGCISSSAHVVARGVHEPKNVGSYRYESDDRLTWICSSSGFRRTVIVSPTPEIYYKSPFSTKHVISALALLRQLKR